MLEFLFFLQLFVFLGIGQEYFLKKLHIRLRVAKILTVFDGKMVFPKLLSIYFLFLQKSMLKVRFPTVFIFADPPIMFFDLVTENIMPEPISAQILVFTPKVVGQEDRVFDHKVCEIHPPFVYMAFQSAEILEDSFDDSLLFFCCGDDRVRGSEKIEVFALDCFDKFFVLQNFDVLEGAI